MIKHLPLVYAPKTGDSSQGDTKIFHHIKNSEGGLVAETFYRNADIKAKHIVKCVNHHDELVAIVKVYLGVLRAVDNNSNVEFKDTSLAIKKVQQLLERINNEI